MGIIPGIFERVLFCMQPIGEPRNTKERKTIDFPIAPGIKTNIQFHHQMNSNAIR